jgi:hypothetical protein
VHLSFPVFWNVAPRHWVIRTRRFERAHWYHLSEFVTKEERRKNKYSSLVIYALEDDAIKQLNSGDVCVAQGLNNTCAQV